MFRLNKKNRIIVGVLAFLLLTPMIVFYILNEQGVFDTRSRASLTQELKEKYQVADMNKDERVSNTNFGLWLDKK